MIFNIQLTLHCNLHCNYCQATADGSPFPSRIAYSIETLKNFIEKDPQAIIAFYGGEPLLEIPLMLEIMDSIRAKEYILQTNGLLLPKVPVNYLKKFHTILISIDGQEKITDFHRGIGTHKKVLKNVKWLKQIGFQGELIARMTVTKEMNIYPEVKWLLHLEDPSFDSIHWQLDMMFNERLLWEDLTGWIKQKYNPQITALITDWLNEMKNNSRVWKIYPFLGVLDRLLFHRSERLHCGAGWIWQNICTDGTIAACPVGADFEAFHIGNIQTTHPLETFNALQV
ncbi:MAG: TIGR04084 family radical SAM/SPASM domain-containing protein, partial [Candidatus Helarchaeota archaeon]